jgi:hypothetical protein
VGIYARRPSQGGKSGGLVVDAAEILIDEAWTLRAKAKICQHTIDQGGLTRDETTFYQQKVNEYNEAAEAREQKASEKLREQAESLRVEASDLLHKIEWENGSDKDVDRLKSQRNELITEAEKREQLANQLDRSPRP